VLVIVDPAQQPLLIHAAQSTTVAAEQPARDDGRVPLQILATPDDPALLDLPWEVELERWPADQLVSLPRGISRHVVRFVRLSGRVYAVKEVNARLARREYDLLRRLERAGMPAVEAVAVLTGRETADSEALESALITRHLQFSLPYRALFSSTLRPETANRLLDALAALLVRLHNAGFYWGDCSLSNTLFRRDAGAFAAYLVDAETGEMHPQLSDGQRRTDLDTAQTNMTGELLDLREGGLLHESIDPVETAEQITLRYESLWEALTAPDDIEMGERWRVEQRVRRLNDLGFDVAEMQIAIREPGRRYIVTPKVVDAGHHSRRLLRLTGLDVQENQARRLLNDLDSYVAEARANDPTAPDELDEEILAHRWLADRFTTVVAAVPRELRGKLEPAEVFHEVLEHRWFLSEQAGRDVGLQAAARDYVDTVLRSKPDEQAVLGSRLGLPTETSEPGESGESGESPP
jgi:tRNA A-37 threonylcarbamoyl transferase component Bud32